MARQTGGTKRSSWLTFRRRLLIVRLLLRNPLSKEQIIEKVRAELGSESYPDAAESALKHDMDALKREFGCRLLFQRSTGEYVLEDLGELALLEVPDGCMEALSFLDASFPPGSPLPEHANIRALLERVIQLLPVSRQSEFREKRSTLVLDMVGRAPNHIDRTVVGMLRRAITFRQEVQFEYMSLSDISEARLHRVAPYRIFFKPQGHGYLDATLLEVTPAGRETVHAMIDYRLDRIVPGTVKILPAMLPPERIQPPIYDLCYELRPIVARRRDVAVYFPESQISYHEDGSATVTAKVTNLWQTRQVLLRYGTGCKVLQPPELVDMFRETAHGLVELYAEKRARKSAGKSGLEQEVGGDT